MVERGRGTIIFTGSSASITGFAGYSDLSKWPAGEALLLLAGRQTLIQLVALLLSLKLILGTNERVQAAASLPSGVCPSRWPGSSSRPACTLRT